MVLISGLEISMYSWRITKYNPKYRDNRGAYLKDEWICYSEIGKKFDHKTFTFKDYIAVENSYVQAILLFVDDLKIKFFLLNGFEDCGLCINDPYQTVEMVNLYKQIKKKKWINKEDLDSCIRLILRGNIWGKLESSSMHVHFGYDYYMYVISIKKNDAVLKSIEKLGLFVEEFRSPYIDD